MVPSHEAFFAGIFKRVGEGDHVVDDILVVGYDAGFESFNGEGEDVGYDEGLGGEGIGTAEE